MAGKVLRAMISLAGKVDPSLLKAIKSAGKAADGLNKSLMSKGMDAAKSVGSGALKVAGAVAKTAAAATAAAGAAGIAIGKSAFDNYAQYEQLVGGVDTLFGSASGKLQQYAADAYKNAGMSANQYMEQATQFSASLVSGLKQDGRSMEETYSMAADAANTAMSDMSDNMNKFGSSMTDIQNAYQGFAKQNYTMLDNLRLGYGGTQAEMARLVNDSGVMGDKFKATAKNINEVSFDKIIEAIHVVQQNMGITGTTAREAATTIEGSVGMMKASWANWLTGLGRDDADMGALTQQLLDSITAVADNVGPRVLQIGKQMVTALPGMLSGAANVLGPVFADTIQQAWSFATSALPDLASSFGPALANLGTTLAPMLSEALASAWNAAGAALSGLGLNLPGLDAGYFMTLFQQISDGVNQIVSAVGPPLQNFINAVMPPLMSAIQGIFPLISAIVSTVLPPLINYITPIASLLANIAAAVIPPLTAAINFLSPAIQLVISAVLTLLPIVSGVGTVISSVQGIMSTMSGTVLPGLSLAFESIGPVISGVQGFFSGLWGVIQEVAGAIGNVIGLIGKLAGAAAKIGGGIVGGIGKLIGFRTGGFTYGPSLAGEDPNYPTEAVISFNPAYRAQNIKYWKAAGHKLGAFSGTRAGGAATVSAGGAHYDLSGMTFSPQVVVRGNASKEDIVAALRQSEGEFVDFVVDALQRRTDASYSGEPSYAY